MDGYEEKGVFPPVGEQKVEEKCAEADQDGEVESRNGEDMLQAESAEIEFQGAIFDVAGDEGAEKGGGAVRGEFSLEIGAEFFLHPEAELGEAEAFLDRGPGLQRQP